MSHSVLLPTALALVPLLATGSALNEDSPLPAPEFAISQTWPFAGSGGWDYLALEPSGARLFVTREDHVDVIETVSGRLAGSIGDTLGVHGVAFAPEFKRGYTSNGRANSVTAFDLDSLKNVQTTAVVGVNPDAILYEAHGKHVLIANGGSSDVSFLDPQTLMTTATVHLSGKPEFMVADDDGTVYVNIETDAGKLAVLDGNTMKLRATWNLAGCARPTGLAFDALHKRLFSACSNQVLAVTDAASGRAVARAAIGRGPDAVAFDPELGLIFTSNGSDGTLTLIHQDSPEHYRVNATLQTQRSARTMVLDTSTHRLFLSAATLGAAPPATVSERSPRASIVPDSFVILVAEPK